MSIVFRAEDVPVRSRVDYWRHVAGETIVPLDLRIPGTADFRSQVRTGDVGAVRVTEVMAPTAELSRTAKLIGRSDPGPYKIDVVAGGQMAVDQDRRQACLGPGDFTLVGLSRLATGQFTCPARQRPDPAALLPLRQDEVARLADPDLSPGMIAARTTSPSATCTSCLRPSRRAWRAGSGAGAWTVAGGICWIRRCRLGRLARRPPGGGSPAQSSSAAPSGPPTGSHPGSIA